MVSKMISLLVATRNRPLKLKEMWYSALQTSYNKDSVELCIYYDEDDEQTPTILSRLIGNIKTKRGPRLTHSDIQNHLMDIAEGPLYGLIGDDVLFRTPNWDIMIEEVFNESKDKIMVAFGDDGFAPPNFATHPFLHKNWYDCLGWISPPHYVKEFADCHINELADLLGRKTKVAALFEHMHYSPKKREYDETDREASERATQVSVPLIYHQLGSLRLEEVKKLQKFIEDKI